MKKTILSLAALSPVLLNAADNRPNIMLIMVDDMGYSDPGCYGGEVHTPNIDSLAKNGLRFTQFYNCSRSCPTRASMLTGMYPHQVGLTHNGNNLTKDCVTIPEVLKEAGYNTGMSGKWHLSYCPDKGGDAQMKWLAHIDKDPMFSDTYASYPCNRGFDEHYGIIWGVADYYDPFSLVHNETPYDTVPDDFYMTNFITEKTVELLDSFTKVDDPFFMYVAYTAPHWPIQALPEDIAKYDGFYDIGWDSLSNKRYKKMVEMGIIDPETCPNAWNESGRKWETETRKALEADHMEVHAAMVDRVDQGIGEIIAKLKATGEFENTIIFFLSDNGASPERYSTTGYDRPAYTRKGKDFIYPQNVTKMDGSQLNMTGIGNAWASAANTPFRYWKTQSFHGGNATPFIIHWPEGLKTQPGSITNQIGHAMDIKPTCLDLAGTKQPETYKGNAINPLEGRSLISIINGGTRMRDTLFWEHENGTAVRVGNWKLVTHTNNSIWQLYDLSKDLSETNNVAAEFPQKVSELAVLYNNWAVKIGRPKVELPEEPDTTKDYKLIFHYPFDNNFDDISLNDHKLVNTGGVSFGEGLFGAAAKFNGSNQYLDMNKTGLLNPKSDKFTICAWIKNTGTVEPSPGNLYEEVILTQQNGGGTGRILLYTRIDEKGDYRFNNFLGGNPNLSAAKYKRNEWMHVAIVGDPNMKTVMYYINGEKGIPVAVTNEFENCPGGFRIGAHKNGGTNWNGYIDEIYLVNGILSEETIKKIMNNTMKFPGRDTSSNHNGEPTKIERAAAEKFYFHHDSQNHVLTIKGIDKIKELNVYSIAGKDMNCKLNGMHLSTAGLNSGIYIVKLVDERNIVYTQKIVI